MGKQESLVVAKEVADVRELRNENLCLGAEDFMGRGDVGVELERVTHVVFNGHKKVALWFKNYPKPLLMNAGHRKALFFAHGHGNVAKWAGATASLYVEKLDRPFNGNTHGVRMKGVKRAKA